MPKSRGRPAAGLIVRVDGFSWDVGGDHRDLYAHLYTAQRPGRRRQRMLELMLKGLQAERVGSAVPGAVEAEGAPSAPVERPAPEPVRGAPPAASKGIGAVKGFRA